MKPKYLVIVAIVLVSIELITYSVAFLQRGPAANMRYWAYTTGDSETPELVCFYLFYPAYFVHSRLLNGDRHFWDSRPMDPAPVFTEDGKAEPDHSANSASLRGR
jgi:hypothetical protein